MRYGRICKQMQRAVSAAGTSSGAWRSTRAAMHKQQLDPKMANMQANSALCWHATHDNKQGRPCAWPCWRLQGAEGSCQGHDEGLPHPRPFPHSLQSVPEAHPQLPGLLEPQLAGLHTTYVDLSISISKGYARLWSTICYLQWLI